MSKNYTLNGQTYSATGNSQLPIGAQEITAPTGGTVNADASNKLSALGYSAKDIAGQNLTPPTTAAPTTVPTTAPGSNPGTVPPPPQNGVGEPGSPQSSGQLSYQQAQQNLASGGLKGADLAGAQSALASKYNVALSSAKNSGLAAPSGAGEGRAAASGYIPPSGTTDTLSPESQNALTTDPYTKILTDAYLKIQNYHESQPSLVSEYQTLLDKSGVKNTDAQLMNLNNVIEGTDSDIRNEITKAGGFATESQVMALSANRQKPLITKYNSLLALKSQQEQYLNTMVSLTQADRAAVDQRMNQSLNFSQMIADHGQKMQDVARQNYQYVVQNGGFQALAQSVAGDPHGQTLAEQAMGLAPGSLGSSKFIASADANFNLDKKYKQLQIANIQSEINARNTSSAGTIDPASALAYINQYASTGSLANIPKEYVGIVAQGAKESKKTLGTVVDNNTGVTSTKLSPAQHDAIAASTDLISKLNHMKSLVDSGQVNTGLFQGLIGSKIMPSKAEQDFNATKNEVVDLLARARSGAVINESEMAAYQAKLPSFYSRPLGLFGPDPSTQIENLKNSLSGKLDATLKTNGVSMYGYSKVPVSVGGKTQYYTVGSSVDFGSGVSGTILPDGSVSVDTQ